VVPVVPVVPVAPLLLLDAAATATAATAAPITIGQFIRRAIVQTLQLHGLAGAQGMQARRLQICGPGLRCVFHARTPLPLTDGRGGHGSCNAYQGGNHAEFRQAKAVVLTPHTLPG
jgi:hypothetical protein